MTCVSVSVRCICLCLCDMATEPFAVHVIHFFSMEHRSVAVSHMWAE